MDGVDTTNTPFEPVFRDLTDLMAYPSAMDVDVDVEYEDSFSLRREWIEVD